MGEEVIGKIDQYIQELASSLGVAAEHLYSVLVRQQFINGVTSLVVSVIAVIAILFLSVKVIPSLLKKGEEKDNSSYLDDGDIYYAGAAGSILVTIFLGIVLYFQLRGGIARVINPEYYAIKEILKVFGG